MVRARSIRQRGAIALVAAALTLAPALPAAAEASIAASIGNFRGDRVTCSARITLRGLDANTDYYVSAQPERQPYATGYQQITTDSRGSASYSDGGSLPQAYYGLPNAVTFLVSINDYVEVEYSSGTGVEVARTTASNRCRGPRT